MNKKLYRSSKNKVIGGVAGGLAEYFNVDPAIIRIIFVLITLAWGASIIIYLVLWISLPSDKTINLTNIDDEKIQEMEEKHISYQKREQFKIIVGILLIAIGCLAFLETLFDWFEFEHLFPIVLILIGIAILTNSILSRESNQY